MTAVYAIVLFVLLIFPHELGHFIVAKAVGVKVNEFAFGMGPALLQKQGEE
ncbi:MAG: site-2 protease family protein, partial [Firmicutes bacterium]|nr:site-2 protease family protein [Bacillota bacterium]